MYINGNVHFSDKNPGRLACKYFQVLASDLPTQDAQQAILHVWTDQEELEQDLYLTEQSGQSFVGLVQNEAELLLRKVCQVPCKLIRWLVYLMNYFPFRNKAKDLN